MVRLSAVATATVIRHTSSCIAALSDNNGEMMRRMAGLPRPLAFVFPGGGALGSYQVGVLAALTAVELGARSVLIISVPLLQPSPPPRKAIDILFRASTFGVEAHGRTMLRRPPPELTVVEIPAPPSLVTTFAVGRSGSAIDDAFRETTEWLASVYVDESAGDDEADPTASVVADAILNDS